MRATDHQKGLSAARLRELLNYDLVAGTFRWKIARGPHRSGALAGHTRADGYVEIRVDGQDYLAHRLAWLHATGEWPAEEIDHLDLDKANNAFLNLREVRSDGKLHQLGYFGTEDEAAAAVARELTRAHGDFARLA